MPKVHFCHFHRQQGNGFHLPCSQYRQINSIENFSLQRFLQLLVRNENLFNEDDYRWIERASEAKTKRFLPNLTRKGCLVTGLIKLWELFSSSSASPAMISAWLRPNGFFISSSSSSAIDLLYIVDWLCWRQKKAWTEILSLSYTGRFPTLCLWWTLLDTRDNHVGWISFGFHFEHIEAFGTLIKCVDGDIDRLDNVLRVQFLHDVFEIDGIGE